MSFSASGGSHSVKSDMNVTPLVDVVLVLLIIFLVTLPMIMREISIDVPKKSDTPPPPDSSAKSIVVKIAKRAPTDVSYTFTLNEVEVSKTELSTKLHAYLERMRESERVVFVDTEGDVLYGDTVALMDTCKGAGAKTVALKMRDEAGAAGAAGAAEPAPAE